MAWLLVIVVLSIHQLDILLLLYVLSFAFSIPLPLPEQPVIYYCKVACPDAIGLILQESRPSLA